MCTIIVLKDTKRERKTYKTSITKYDNRPYRIQREYNIKYIPQVKASTKKQAARKNHASFPPSTGGKENSCRPSISNPSSSEPGVPGVLSGSTAVGVNSPWWRSSIVDDVAVVIAIANEYINQSWMLERLPTGHQLRKRRRHLL